MSTESFAHRLRQLRDGNSWTAQVMAEKTGLPKRTIESYMRHENPPLPGLEALQKISKGLRVTLDWLVFGVKPVSDDAGRLVRLSVYAAALPVINLILSHHRENKPGLFTDQTIIDLTPEQWAAEIGWDAGERAMALAGRGVSQDSLQVAQKVIEKNLLAKIKK